MEGADRSMRQDRPATRSRRRRVWPGNLVAAAIVVGAALFGGSAGAQTDEPTRNQQADVLARGAGLFQAHCAACHGTRGEGGPGPGDLAGPPIDEVDVNFVDLTLRTGRMPIPAPSHGIRITDYDDAQREAVVAFMRERFDLPGELPTVGEGDASRGQELYVRNCAACHAAAASGGISGAAVQVPPLTGLDPIAIHQGTRVGPFEMPAFEQAVLDDQAIADMVAYLAVVDEAPRTAGGLQELDAISSALLMLALTLAAGLVVLVVARARRWSTTEPEGFHTTDPFEPR
ncbi:c-type cytochrome [Egicoccus sp. AB-alg2]|uniref:c-type cytochrome n=1 Tax=Egicoccus sp. AB-alg2 TaxID=3242693 RepID=UPI00359DC1F4